MGNEAWAFEEHPQKAVRRDPFEAEFFTGEEDTEEVYGRTDALVRETIQNSLDAAWPERGRPVTVRFGISLPDEKLSTADAAAFLEGLLPHLDALGNEFVNKNTGVPEMSYLVVEDFQTLGLGGDPKWNGSSSPEGERVSDFYWFWRNIGRSGKGGTDRGRWGLGKTVFPATSKINTLFGLTVRREDNRHMLMGQAITKVHELNGKEFVPEGFFCDPATSDELQMPFEDDDTVKRFREAFRLKRDSEPGLSIVVPYLFDRIDARELVRSVIIHFFYPILKGDLEVEIHGPGIGEVQVTTATIRTVANSLEWKGSARDKKNTPPPFQLATWAIQMRKEGKLAVLKKPEDSKVPVWGEHLFEEKQLAELRNEFSSGNKLAVRIPMAILKKDGTVEQSYFDVFVERDADLTSSVDHFVREGMTISKISTLGGQRGLRGLLIVEDKYLSSLLGDAEGPAHTRWGTGETRPDANYKTWKKRVGFVRNGIAKLVSLLCPPPEGLDEDWLHDIFSIEDPVKKGSKKRKKRGPKEPPPPPPPPPPPRERQFEVVECEGGFCVRGVGVGNSVPAKISIRVAYDLPDGNPFRNYSPIDFTFGKKRKNPLAFTHKKLKIEERSDNRISIAPKSKRFMLKVVGFDTNRDLIIRATAEEAAND